jgi:hypothetical protein
MTRPHRWPGSEVAIWVLLGSVAACGSPGGTDESEATMASVPEEADLRAAIVARANDLGAEIRSEDIRLEFLADDVVPGYRVFRGIYSYRDMRDAVTGIVTEDGTPDTYPHRALGRIYARWLERSGDLPEPAIVAEVVSFLIGGAGPYEVLTSEDDLARITDVGAQGVVGPPRAVDVDGQPGVVFWWEKRIGLVEVTVHMTGPEEIALSQRTLLEVIGD